MGKIFCIMGKSSVGKDTIFRMLQEERHVALSPVVTYTTRPRRVNETEGVAYHFISTERLQQLEEQGVVIEKRSYHTIGGIWSYATIEDGQFDDEDKNYILITTLEGYTKIYQRYTERVIPIYIEVPDGERLLRAIMREKNEKNPNYEELCRRFLADNEDFSQEKLLRADIFNRYENHDIQNCLKKIVQEIKKEIL